MFGFSFHPILRSIFTREWAKFELFAVNHLINQGILDFKTLSSRKLKDCQLALGLSSKKTVKTLAVVENRLEVKL